LSYGRILINAIVFKSNISKLCQLFQLIKPSL